MLSVGGERACVSRALWTRWLDGRVETSFCGEWRGRWKSFAPARNEPTPPRPRSGATEPPVKSPLEIFRVLDFPKEAEGKGEGAARACLRWIESARERAHAWLAPKDATGALTHLVTGTREPGGGLEFLLLLGFVHVLSASGIHLYAIVRWWRWLVERASVGAGLSPERGLQLARAAAFASGTAAWLLAGARPGMLRPWLIVGMRGAARRQGVRWRRWAPLALAMAADLAVGAWRGDLSSNRGRWIYALAVGGGLMARSAPAMAVSSWILAAVWQAWSEAIVAIGTPIASLVTVGAYSVALYPGALLALALRAAGASRLSEALATVAGWASEALIRATSEALMGAGLWVLPRPALLGGLALGALALRAGLRARVALAGALVAARIVAEGIGAPGGAGAPAGGTREAPPARVEQLDVGQGDAALVRGAGVGLIDAGSERALRDTEWILLLAGRGVTRIDWVALTHLDEDHAGGLVRLARLVPIGCVATSREEMESERGRRIQAKLAPWGARITDWGGGCVPYPALEPPFPAARGAQAQGRRREKAPTKPNGNMSAVLVPLAKGGFYLSAGDASAEDEPRIGRWAAGWARAGGSGREGPRILKVSHHGSRSSSDAGFLAEVRPTEAWISAGVGNRYGHPTRDVLVRLRELGIPIRRTDIEGALRAPE